MSESSRLILFQVLATSVLLVWIACPFLIFRTARRKNRSQHWTWAALHPVVGIIIYFVLRNLPPMKECPNCAERLKAHARVCAYCLTPFQPTLQENRKLE